MLRLCCLFLGIGMSLAPLAAPAQQDHRSNSTRIIIPAETHIPVITKNRISTRTAYVGQRVYCETTFPIAVDNQIVIPIGTYVRGSVTQVVRAGRIKGKARLGIRFDSLILPNGETFSLRSALSAAGTRGNEGFDKEEGRVKGEGTKGKDAQAIIVTGAKGALIGAIVGRGKGAAIGGGVGAGVGLATALFRRGKDVVLPSGTDLEFVLLQPVELSSYSSR